MTVHFQNFLGTAGSAFCGVDHVAEPDLTLNPIVVTCERCLERLGRSRAAHLGAANDHKSAGQEK